MHLLALTRYGTEGPSSRVRLLQYLPALESAGIRVRVEPFFEDNYVAGLYRGRVPRASVLRSYVRRLVRATDAWSSDIVWLEKELFPWVPDALERFLSPSRVPLVVDYDDAVFHRYDLHGSALVRGMLGQKIDGVMRRADCVMVGNEYLAERARAAGSRRVEWLPTVVDLHRYTPRSWPGQDPDRVVIGWIGSPATARFLREVSRTLQEATGRWPIRCVAIGARPDQLEGTPFEHWPWSEESEAELLRNLDIGIMPLPDRAFERGKCGYKLIQYMACGVPVIASPVGINRQIVTEGVGFLAARNDEWARAVGTLAADPHMRQRMGEAGRASVEQTYSLQVQAPRFVAMLRDIVSGGG